MPFVEPRTIAELIALYEIEPEVRDVFVEGSDDAIMLKWYLRRRGHASARVQEIGDIDIPSSVVEAYGLDVGNRGRVLALAEELNKQLKGPSRNGPTLVYDADSDRLFGPARSIEMLIPTDFTCLEMYLFNEATVDKLISVVLIGGNVSAQEALRTLAGVLVRVWAIKWANHMLGLSMSWVPFVRCCKLSGETIEFDEDEFIKRYLVKSGLLNERQVFEKQVSMIEERMSDDPRDQMDGHHFFTLARWFFRHFAKERKLLVSDKAFGRIFFGCLELEGSIGSHCFSGCYCVLQTDASKK